tara:strand:+ start:1283 stop:1534 length:252 start_codon:yes stop_codon:yes gene_type:complete
VEIKDLVQKTEDYIRSNISEHNRSLATMLLEELKKIEKDDSYIVPADAMRSLIDSFDYSSDYWKKYFSVYWNENLDKFQNPYE